MTGISLNDIEHAVDRRVGEQNGLQAEIGELRMLRVVVVFFKFDARIDDVVNADLDPGPLAGSGHLLGKIVDRELLGELVEDPERAGLGRMICCQRNALQRVADVEKAARLAAHAVNC